MSFAINVQELCDRASKRVATLATAATLLPDTGSKVARLATDAEDSDAWTDADITRFLARRDRLMRWGWAEADAEALAERLTRRDREGDDDRVVCAAECQHFRGGRCGNHRAAGLNTAEVGRDLASLLQRCPGSDSRKLAGPYMGRPTTAARGARVRAVSPLSLGSADHDSEH